MKTHEIMGHARVDSSLQIPEEQDHASPQTKQNKTFTPFSFPYFLY